METVSKDVKSSIERSTSRLVELQRREKDGDLLLKRNELEENIRSYKGDDPLECRYNFISWIENSYPNRGLDDGLISTLEQTLSLFKDDQKYKQDTRYVALLIKYINLLPNSLEMYQCIYNQGRGTKCAILYHAWASKCEEIKDYKLANEIYLMGINNKAEPLEDLTQVHVQFQFNMGRRLLGVADAAPNTPCREALRKLQINNHPIQLQGSQGDKNIVEKRVSQISSFNKENTGAIPKKMKEILNKESVPSAPTYYAQFKGRIKTDQPDTFRCPVVHFEPEDPSKLVMYPKAKIYAIENHEFQLEELIASSFETCKKQRFRKKSNETYDNIMTQNSKERKVRSTKSDYGGAWSQDLENIPVAYFDPEDPNKIVMYPKSKIYSVENTELQLEELKAMEYEKQPSKPVSELRGTTLDGSAKTPTQGTPKMQVSCEKALQDSNANTSLFNNQSMTVATKEAMKLVRGMWSSPSPVSVKTYNAVASSKEVEPEAFKVPPPPKPSGFELYVDESACQLPSTSKPANRLRLSKPFIPFDVENIPVVPKTGSILRNSSRNKDVGITPKRYPEGEFGVDFGVGRLNNDEDVDTVSHKATLSVKKQPLQIYTDEGDLVEACANDDGNHIGLLKTVTPLKVDYAKPSSSYPMTTSTTSARKSGFVVLCDDSVIDQEGCHNQEDVINQVVPITSYGNENKCPRLVDDDVSRKNQETILPYVPSPQNSAHQLEDELKENACPDNYSLRRPEKRDLSRVLQPSKIPIEALQFQQTKDDDVNDTCNTRVFAFALPSSTPFSNQSRNYMPNSADNENTVTYCSSYAPPEEIAKQTMGTDLSVILEASKERYSSSSGNSSSGQTPYGPSRLKTLNSCNELKGSKLCHISEESINDVEKGISYLNLKEDIDPFCPDLLTNLLSHIKFPQKHHLPGYTVIDHNAPVLRENCTITIGNNKYITKKELGRGTYARVLKATNNNNHVALKYQKPAFVWEYYIACEIRKRLASSPMKNGFIEINRVYTFNNASIMETEWGKFGSLVDVVNTVKRATGSSLKESVATLLCVQLFSIVEHLHRCKIIHGDIKPDNFVLHALPTSDFSQLCIKLIDFGRSIDMTLLPEGTVFTTVVTTDGFQCNEMKENRPWTYQTDYYGLAGTAYCLLMGDYMKVIKTRGKWGLQKPLPRYAHRECWQPIFLDLLNVESCNSLPNLSLMRTNLEELLRSMGRLVIDQLNSIANIIQGH